MPAARATARWTREATDDLREIWRYYALVGSPELADSFTLKLTEAGTRIAQRPLTWRARNDIAPGLRSMRVPPYSLYYRVTSGEVEILRVLHERRNVAGLLGKLLRGGDI